jgi:hypothetical protein
MSDILAIVGAQDSNEEVLAEIARARPDRVTVLVSDGSRLAVRGRLSALLDAIEERTGAVVVGSARSREQLLGWRFDRVVGGRSAPVA